MGRSLYPIALAPPIEKLDPAARNPFRAGPIEYRVEQRDGKTVHIETLRSSEGKTLAQAEAEIAYAVGSGVSGRSYLISYEGWLFMSSLTWYPRRQLWDLSPGYSVRNHHFTRPIMTECLFCHANQVRPEPGSLNRFHPPIFDGHQIGCERCHGPGQLHVEARQASARFDAVDWTIVNPKHLEPRLREAVCQQCHLQGQHRVLRPGVEPFDYRPGLPLEDFLTVFVRHPAWAADDKFVGQVEQMYQSACFRKSGQALGCTTCHDPHYLPAKEERPAWYRRRCLGCHQEHDCRETAAARQATRPADHCVHCHMPVNEANITHTAYSDHRILRRPEPAGSAAAERRLPPGELPLVPFPPRGASRTPALDRDLGVALMMMAENHPERVQQELARLALPLLQQALDSDPGDVAAREALANALWTLGLHEEAADQFETLLRQAPRRETAVSSAASLATSLGRWRIARSYWEKAIALNPYRWRYRLGLATAHARLEDWHSAWYETRQGIRLHPFSPELRQLAVTCLLALGDAEAARRELEVLIALEPESAERHRAWFQSLAASP
jgi:hypothetical protein